LTSPRALGLLALAALFTALAFGSWALPVAAWLAPLFTLRFVRTQSPWLGYGVGAVMSAGVGAFTLDGFIPLSGAAFYGFVVVASFVGFLPYLADRLLAPRLGALAGSLVLPAAATALEHLTSFGAYGTWGSIAYTQTSLTLLQLTSITGIWGVTFVVYWTASVVNAAWEPPRDWSTVRRPVGALALVVVVVIGYGSVRLAGAPSDRSTVRTAAVTEERGVNDLLSRIDLNDWASFRATSDSVQHAYLQTTRRAVEAGAEIVAWPEGAVPLAAEDESAFVAEAQALAERAQVTLGLSLLVLTPSFPKQPADNKVVWITPDGFVAAQYWKAIPVPGEPSRPGDGVLPVVETPGGRLTSVICFDMDHPRLLRQAGRNRADLLVAPSNDWPAIADLHAHMARVRAIENGTPLLRPASNGTSIAVDAYGRLQARMPHTGAAARTMLVPLATGHVSTLYPHIGDAFAWLCLLGTVGLVARVVLRTRDARTETAVPA
jgi:apolipoprotein N-acyltransferase